MSKHTPGPYVVRDAGLMLEITTESVGEDFKKIAFMQSDNPADAKLLAAAPEMFALLETAALLHHITESGRFELVKRIEAFIAKMEGK